MSALRLVPRRGALIVGLLGLLGATLAVAQVPPKPAAKDTAKSAKQAGKPTPTAHIKIQKEKEQTSGGEVAPIVRVDSVVCQVDTVPLIDPLRDESIRRSQFVKDSTLDAFLRRSLIQQIRTEERDRYAAIELAKETAAAAALKARLARGYYFGIAGGASTPQRGLRDGYTGGYNVTLPFGFDATNSPLGLRADMSIDHLNGTIVRDARWQNLAANGDITVWSVNSDLKLRVPTPGASTRTHMYLLGGVGAHKVTGGVYGTTDPKAGQNVSFSDASLRFGWNAGAGAAIAWGPAEVFIESRFFQVKSDLAYRTAGGVGTYTTFTPILVGLQWF